MPFLKDTEEWKEQTRSLEEIQAEIKIVQRRLFWHKICILLVIVFQTIWEIVK